MNQQFTSFLWLSYPYFFKEPSKSSASSSNSSATTSNPLITSETGTKAKAMSFFTLEWNDLSSRHFFGNPKVWTWCQIYWPKWHKQPEKNWSSDNYTMILKEVILLPLWETLGNNELIGFIVAASKSVSIYSGLKSSSSIIHWKNRS